MMMICLHTVQWFQVFLSNTDNSINEIFLGNIDNLRTSV